MSNNLSLSTQATPAATSDRPIADPNRASAATWIAVLAAMIGSFMAILNIQITNASLANIEGGIGTGADNGSWISTSYLIGEIIVIPLTDYLSRVFTFRHYMLASATLFAAFSVACAFTHDLPSMIAMRGLQGSQSSHCPSPSPPRSARPSAAISPRTTAGARSSSST
jgi:DHA2 family multidrug resistance protein